ncbi:hypothetical protein SS50377_28109 [Spironucleus salmonicida]|uniref:Uncharacterized protein n=1 Tax=Spironucleus salmonicida TaxID=348837 RepID=V6LE92_9EUKA|nr:hypothetical protein SS50377_28109 [Spironucleus salmonicida]|eukprot:EST42792.1 Hypothetical protein SS50377_17561 [Spironucleus salmonicida]
MGACCEKETKQPKLEINGDDDMSSIVLTQLKNQNLLTSQGKDSLNDLINSGQSYQ